MGELEALYNNVFGRTYNIKPCRTADHRPSDRLRLDRNRLRGCTLYADGNIGGSGVITIAQDDDVSWRRIVDGRLQGR